MVKLEDATETIEADNVVVDFRTSLSQFTFEATSAKSEIDTTYLRRSPRKPVRRQSLAEASSKSSSSPSPSRKRAGKFKEEIETPSRRGSPLKKAKRGYAPPETYAHLDVLKDHLKPELDVMFCGINPGYKSAETGHHFASPTNHFWKCLYQSGLTSRRLPPTEDFTLPELFNLGLTNLVDRPSAEQAELSRAEMTRSVPRFLTKIMRYRPRIVCFVGRGMWLVVEKVLCRMSSHPVPLTVDTELPLPSAVTKKVKLPKKIKGSKYGLQPYKIVYDCPSGEGIKETLFFVSASTSGRVVIPKLPDKVKLFTTLRMCIEDIKASKVATAHMAVVPLPKFETSE